MPEALLQWPQRTQPFHENHTTPKVNAVIGPSGSDSFGSFRFFRPTALSMNRLQHRGSEDTEKDGSPNLCVLHNSVLSMNRPWYGVPPSGGPASNRLKPGFLARAEEVSWPQLTSEVRRCSLSMNRPRSWQVGRVAPRAPWIGEGRPQSRTALRHDPAEST